MKHTSAQIEALQAEGTLQHLALCVGRGEDTVFETYVCPQGIPDEHTLFDMASVTKVVVSTTLALRAWSEGLISPQESVSSFFPCPPDKRTLTVRHLLTHTMGIGHRNLCAPGNTYDNIAEKILALPLESAPGQDVRYSCPAFVLLGKILEKIYGARLDTLFNRLVAKPLAMEESGFLPDPTKAIVPSDKDPRSHAVVNDYNCRYLGGVAGNAGLFSNMHDMRRYVRALLRGGDGLFRTDVLNTATQNLTANIPGEARGLGFLYVDNRYTQTADLFAPGSVGHTGWTGQSVFFNRESKLFVILLTDATRCSEQKHGEVHYDEVMRMRQLLHGAIARDLAVSR